MILGYGRRAYANCVGPAPTLTCTGTITGTAAPGVVNGGILVPGGYTTVNVNSLTADITPNSGVDGISFTSVGSITINSDTGAYSIVATGVGGDGIFASSGSGAVTVDSTGDITSSDGAGVFAVTSGAQDTKVYSTGTVQSYAVGLFAYSMSGAVTLHSTGDVTSTDGTGILAANMGAGNVEIISDGAVTADQDAINAGSGTGNITVTSTGDLESYTGSGVAATTTGSGTVTIDSSGVIDAYYQGISALSDSGAIDITNDGNVQGDYTAIFASSGSGAVTVDSTGDITSSDGAGVFAVTSGAQDTKVYSTGTVQSYAVGLFAYSMSGAVTLHSTGDVTSTDGTGILAANMGAGNVEIISDGAVTADQDAINAGSGTGNITVTSTGDLESYTGSGVAATTTGSGTVTIDSSGVIDAYYQGISALSDSGAIDITNDGNVQGDYTAIFASSGSGAVTVDSTGDITSSDGAGVFAVTSGAQDTKVYSTGTVQSYAVGLFAYSMSGAVTLHSTGDVTSTDGTGILAANMGAGNVEIISDGAVTADQDAINAGSGTGNITVTSTGDVNSTSADGLVIQGGSSSTVTLFSGTVNGASDGVEFVGGGTNSLKNYAALTGDVYAVHGGTGNETINNYNLITGDVHLGGGTNAFFNRAGGTFRSGATANLGGGTLNNSGNLSPGDTGTIQTTVLTGNLVQTSDGTFTVDLEEGAAQEADLVTVTGTANFAGHVAVNIINLTSSSGSVVIADAGGGTTNTAKAVDTPTIDFSLSVVAGTQLVLNWQPTVPFILLDGPFTPNQEATAIYLDTINTSGPSAALLAFISAIKGLPNEAAIIAALDRLHGEHYLAQVNDTLLSSRFFLNSIMSCPTAGGVAMEGQCYWAKIGGRTHDWDRTRTQIGGDEEAWSVSGGLQVALDRTWRLGFALSYEDTRIDTNDSARSEGDRVEGGVVLKNRWGDSTLAAALFGGNGWFDTERTIGVGGIGAAQGDHAIAFGGVQARLAHVFSQNSWYVRPMVDLNATYLDYGGFRERGAGVVSLAVQGEEEWVLSVSPALELGGDYSVANGTIFRPYVRIGGTFYNDTNFSLTSSFLSAPSGVTPFTIKSEFDEAYLDASAGLDVLSVDGLEVKLNYDGRFSEDSEMHSGGAKVGVKF